MPSLAMPVLTVVRRSFGDRLARQFAALDEAPGRLTQRVLAEDAVLDDVRWKKDGRVGRKLDCAPEQVRGQRRQRYKMGQPFFVRRLAVSLRALYPADATQMFAIQAQLASTAQRTPLGRCRSEVAGTNWVRFVIALCERAQKRTISASVR
jgi:hypothetical protein